MTTTPIAARLSSKRAWRAEIADGRRAGRSRRADHRSRTWDWPGDRDRGSAWPAGAPVALVARTPAQLDEVRHAITASGGTAVAIAADVGDARAASAAVDEAVASLGRIDVLVNNAALVAPLGPTQSLDPAEIETALEVNVAAPIVLTGLVLPGMLAKWVKARS